MRVVLIGPNIEENLSLNYLASSLESAGHTSAVLNFNSEEDIPVVVGKVPGAGIAGLSLTFQALGAAYFQLARIIKKLVPDTRIVAGGHFATCAAEEILLHHPEIDVIVLHEGEETIVDLANLFSIQDANPRRIKGIAYRRGSEIVITPPRSKVEDLDTLPMPKRGNKDYILAGVPTAYILGSRGCMNSCTYCCISTLHQYSPGKRFRQRDAHYVVEEMAQLYQDRGVRHFVFHDDNFLVPSMHKNLLRLDALEREMQFHGLRDISLTIKCSPQEVHKMLFAKLKELGLVRVFLGIESSSNIVTRKFNRSQNAEQSENALAICRSLGISAQFNIMLFHPYADFHTIESDIAFMEKHIDYPFNFCRTEIYAGTPLEREMIAAGRTRGNYAGKTYTMSSKEIDHASAFFRKLFYKRCWSNGSLAASSISSDHLSSLLLRHYDSIEVQPLRNRIREFVTSVNSNSINLLKSMVELFNTSRELPEMRFGRKSRRIVQKEENSRRDFERVCKALNQDINRYVLEKLTGGYSTNGDEQEGRSKRNLQRRAIAAALALSVSGAAVGANEFAPPPLGITDDDEDGLLEGYELEIFNTDPNTSDTDMDGIPDGEEDHDDDGLSNWDYQVREENPLIFLIQTGQTQRALLQIASGEWGDPVDSRGRTAIMAAVVENELNVVKMLLSSGFELNAKNNDGKTALDLALSAGSEEMVALLRLHGAKTGD